jgi:hypothetical protein
LFSDRVANAREANIFRINRIFDFIDFDTILSEEHSFIRKEARKAEIMVFDSISIDKIKGITYGN